MKNLELEFVLEREKRYLEQNPSQATRLALNYLEDYLRLAEETKTLEQKLEHTLAENYVLTSYPADVSSAKERASVEIAIDREVETCFCKNTFFFTLSSSLKQK